MTANKANILIVIRLMITGFIVQLVIYSSPVFADELDRLFTTKEERGMLEKLRNEKTKSVEEITDFVLEEEKAKVGEAKPDVGGITVRGLVYRKDGQSTAWINSGNTYEGDIGNQYLQVDSGNIDTGNLEIDIPVNLTRIKLKVGQTYDPTNNSVEDIVNPSP